MYGKWKHAAQEHCRAKLGKLDLAIHPRSFQEVKAHNAAGQCWLVLDGDPLRLEACIHPAPLECLFLLQWDPPA